MRCHFLLWAATEPVMVNNDKWPEDDEIPKHITKSHLSRVLMYCSTCQPTHTSSFTLWQLSQGFFFSFGSITHNCTHFRAQLRGWCSVRAPTAWASVPPPGIAVLSVTPQGFLNTWGRETVAQVGCWCQAWLSSGLWAAVGGSWHGTGEHGLSSPLYQCNH